MLPPHRLPHHLRKMVVIIMPLQIHNNPLNVSALSFNLLPHLLSLPLRLFRSLRIGSR